MRRIAEVSKENIAMRRFASIVFLLTSIVIALGAFGHDSNAAKMSAELARFPGLDPMAVSVILAVWHFCSGCMLVLGLTCIWVWWRARRGERQAFVLTDLVGVFYIASGAASVIYTGKPFFWVFVLLGALLIVASVPLRRAA